MNDAMKTYLESVLDENARLRARIAKLEAALAKADELVSNPPSRHCDTAEDWRDFVSRYEKETAYRTAREAAKS